jgi:hypothetical protein
MGKFILLQYVLRPEAAELPILHPEWTVLVVFMADPAIDGNVEQFCYFRFHQK